MNKFVLKHFYLILILCGLSILFPYLGNVHLFDWDEANFAEIAREMILTKNYLQPQINYLPFYEKPPIFIWYQVVSMKLFGINEFAARFPNALLGVLVMLSLYWIGKRECDNRFGRIWVITYMGSFLPLMYFRTGLIDPWFNYFMFLSLYFYYRGVKHKLNRTFLNFTYSAIFLGLAVQTKGPAALIIVFGTIGILWLVTKFKTFPGILPVSLWIFFGFFFSSLWFLYETYQHGTGYMYEFIVYQIRLFTTEDALHGGPFYYHFIVLLLGCFPASFIILFTSGWQEKLENDWFKIMCICGVLVLVLFSIVQTKIIHYSSMAYFPLSYIAAHALYSQSIRKMNIVEYFFRVVIIILLIILIFLPIIGKNIAYILPYIKDVQTKLQLGSKVNWHYWEVCFGIFILITFVFLKTKYRNVIYPYFVSTIGIVLVLLIVFAPKIERYTQGEYIDFCKEFKAKSVDIQPLYIKSYAIHYYSEKKPFINKEDTLKHLYYLYGPITRPVYFIARAKDTSRIPGFTPFHIRNGFAFYKRTP